MGERGWDPGLADTRKRLPYSEYRTTDLLTTATGVSTRNMNRGRKKKKVKWHEAVAVTGAS